MNIEELKSLALRMLFEEHLWKVGEKTSFEFSLKEYQIGRVENGFTLSTYNKIEKTWNKPKEFASLGRLFSYFFNCNFISY